MLVKSSPNDSISTVFSNTVNVREINEIICHQLNRTTVVIFAGSQLYPVQYHKTNVFGFVTTPENSPIFNVIKMPSSSIILYGNKDKMRFSTSIRPSVYCWLIKGNHINSSHIESMRNVIRLNNFVLN